MSRGTARGAALARAGTGIRVLDRHHRFSSFGTAGGGSVTFPWQFQPETYGAKGNGQVCGDVGTNGTSVVTSPTIGALGQAAVGMYIMIHGANGNAGPYTGTITAVSGNNVTVSGTAPTNTVANCPAVFGTDDTAAINSAVTAAKNYALANSFFAEVLFEPDIYILGTGPTKTGDGATVPTFNSQIPLPYPNANGTTQKLILALTGAGDAGYLQYWESLIPNVSGTALVSMLNPSSAAANDATFGRQSVIGGPSGSAGFTGGYANVKIIARGIGIWTAIWHNLICWDLAYVSAARREECGATTFAPTGVNGSSVLPYQNNITATTFLNSISIGYRAPVSGNNLDIADYDCMSQNQEIGFLVFDHYAFWPVQSNYCDVAMKNDGGLGASGTQHGLFGHARMENYNGGLRTSGGLLQCFIIWDCENSGAPNYDVNDAGPALFGDFIFGDKVDNRAPSISVATNLKVTNQNLAPGHWGGAPVVPASTVAQQNTAWRDAWVSVHCGAGVTVSVINVDGTVTGLTIAAATSLAVRVPSGKNITLTYAGGTPTWDWWLD